MDVRVFTPHYNEGNRKILEAFASAIGATVSDDRKYIKCDVAVIFGMVKKSFAKSHSKQGILDGHKGKPLLVIERGFLKRDQYFSVGWGGINGKADFVNEDVSAARWNALGLELKPWRMDTSRNVIVCGQVPWDVTVQDTDHIEWCRTTVKSIQALGGTAIFRPHPAVASKVNYGVQCPLSYVPLKQDLARCTHVVTYCSNTAVEAVVEGIPSFSFSDMSMAWSVTSHNLLKAFMPDRTEWAWRLAHAQWKPSEFAAAWEQVKRRIL